jgi:predicted Zn-dependent peptidase
MQYNQDGWRSIAPEIKSIESVSYRKADSHTLSNGIPVYTLSVGNEDVVRIDCMFRAGIYYQKHPLIASFTNQLLKEGTRSRNAAEIAEKLDFYGSWLHLSCTHHYAYLTLYSLNKYLPQTIRLLEDMLSNAVFPEKEFEIYLNKRKQQYLIDQKKVQSLARRNFLSALYGAEHPYGKTADMNDFNRLKTEWLREFYRQFYTPDNCQIIVSGKITPAVLDRVKNTFENTGPAKSGRIEKTEFTVTPSPEHHQFIEKADSIQSAVQIGRPMFSRKHPDYHKFRILNTVLGGYFGSRLMSSIREDKGYTYGITSGLTSFLDAGHFSIVTQTGIEFTQPLIREVYNEMERLCSEPVPEAELETVKNYMLGEHIRMFDGGFALTDTFTSLLANELDYSFYEKNIEIIRSATAEELQALAVKYFDTKSFYEVIAGGTRKS